MSSLRSRPPAHQGSWAAQLAADVVALDMDGTILDGGTDIHPEAVTAIRRCAASGVKVVTASGRPHEFQLDVLERHGLDRGEFAALICDERELWLFDEPRTDGRAQYVPFGQWNEPTLARWRGLAAEALSWVDWCLGEVARHDWTAWARFTSQEVRERGLGVVALETEGAAIALLGRLSSRPSREAPHLSANRNRHLVQIHDSTVDKATSLVALSSVLGVDTSRVLAIGDSDNDRTMLDGSHGFQSATIANATESAKAAVSRSGGVVARRSSGAGVADVLGALA